MKATTRIFSIILIVMMIVTNVTNSTSLVAHAANRSRSNLNVDDTVKNCLILKRGKKPIHTLKAQKNKLFLDSKCIKTFPKNTKIELIGISRKSSFYINAITKKTNTIYEGNFKRPKHLKIYKRNRYCICEVDKDNFILNLVFGCTINHTALYELCICIIQSQPDYIESFKDLIEFVENNSSQFSSLKNVKKILYFFKEDLKYQEDIVEYLLEELICLLYDFSQL